MSENAEEVRLSFVMQISLRRTVPSGMPHRRLSAKTPANGWPGEITRERSTRRQGFEPRTEVQVPVTSEPLPQPPKWKRASSV